MFKAQDYAFQIAVTLKSVFKTDKFGLGLVTDLDFIEKNPFIPMSLVLGNFYNSLDSNSKIKVDDFIERYYWSMDKTIEELGEDKTKEIIEEFKEIVKIA